MVISAGPNAARYARVVLSLGIDIGGTRVKLALFEEDSLMAQIASTPYERPTLEALVQRVREGLDALQSDRTAGKVRADAVGLAVPGVLSEDRRRVEYSANIPGLSGHDLSLFGLLAGGPGVRSYATSDQIAAATDYAAMFDVQGFRIRGRLLAVSIGTGVGAAVLDFDSDHPLGRPLRVNGDSPGHIGQMDVALGDKPPTAADGGAGSLEAYIGAGALRGRDPGTLGIDDEAIQALVRALRICHAIYRPHEIAVLGGVGTRLRHLETALHQRINQNLTRIARDGWRLGFGRDDFHAARGAARLALNVAKPKA